MQERQNLPHGCECSDGLPYRERASGMDDLVQGPAGGIVHDEHLSARVILHDPVHGNEVLVAELRHHSPFMCDLAFIVTRHHRVRVHRTTRR